MVDFSSVVTAIQADSTAWIASGMVFTLIMCVTIGLKVFRRFSR